MGTINLTMVIDQKGEKKVAQYGQWDGYPSGVGVKILRFIKNKRIFDKFKANLSKVRFLDEEGIDKKFVEDYDKNASNWSDEPDNRTKEQKRWFYMYCSRDLAEKALINIANSKDEEIVLIDSECTAENNTWLEYRYIINLKENTLGVYRRYEQEPMKVYKLDELPEDNTFIAELEENEEEFY